MSALFDLSLDAPPIDCLEAVFGKALERLFDHFGWQWYHEPDSRRSRRGFPDYVAVRERESDKRCIFSELKRQKRAWLKPDQKKWLDSLRAVADQVAPMDRGFKPLEVYLWKPGDWDQIVEILR
jgi:hypothetical protein